MAVRARGRKTARAARAIEVRGARTHNLKSVDCRIPHGRLTVVTGPSGAGKSSLAFDTVFAEGQRRFVESMSTYARQFLNQMERPPVEAVDNILPPVALEAKNAVRNARSTVATITEVQDVLRLLFTHLGEMQCPNGHGPVRKLAVEQMVDLLVETEAGERFLLVVRVPRPKRKATEVLREYVRQGYRRRLEEGSDEIVRMEPADRWPLAMKELALVLGRYRAAEGARPRIAETLEEAFRLGRGRVKVRGQGGGPGEEKTLFLARGIACRHCGLGFRPLSPALFSFNSPLGACETCQGFGRVVGIDRERVIPNPRLSLEEKPIAPWNTPAYEKHYRKLFKACREEDVPLDVPWEELAPEVRDWIWQGPGSFTTLDRFFRWLERRNYRLHLRVLLARYRSYTACPDCDGTRLKPEARSVLLSGRTLPELSTLSVERLREWLAERSWTDRQRETAGHLLEELRERVEVLYRVGLGYLTLDRQARTLSGGETQRIHLAAALGSGLTSTLYVLDEPTIGLHPSDSARLLSLLKDLALRGNTVLVVEHDRTLIEGADHVIDLGPAAGERGGEVMIEGPPPTVLAFEGSLTGRYLGGATRREEEVSEARRHAARWHREHGGERRERWAKGAKVVIRNARAHNLRGIDVEIPLGALTAVTGMSGSGKSTLVENVLHGTYQRSRGVVDVEPGECDALEGLDGLGDVTLVDQKPLGRSSRSNPVTYVKAYDEIRKLFAGTTEARALGVTAGHFSFNLDRGRCPECKGTGVTEVDMHFMAPVSVTCDKCQGHRFQQNVLGVRWRGRNIAETLELTVDEARGLFADQRRLCRKLDSLVAVGLGYLRLGQATSTLSGGEAQRLKLASFLDRSSKEAPRLFLFDEPTTGLHVSDIDLLNQTLRRLVHAGHTVVVVEHSPDLIARADWVVDLGPGGGSHGGDLLFSGPLEAFLEAGEGPTARELRRFLQAPAAEAAP